MEGATSIVLGSYEPVTLLGLRHALPAEEHSVIGAYSSAAALLTACRNVPTRNVTILDAGMLGSDAGATVRNLSTPENSVLLFGDRRLVDDLPTLLRAGGRGFVDRASEVDAVAAAVRAVTSGRLALDDDVRDRVTALLLEVHESVPALSPRERDILRLMGAGMSSAQVASELHLSEPTVKTYLARASRKLGVRGRVATVARAIRLGILR